MRFRIVILFSLVALVLFVAWWKPSPEKRSKDPEEKQELIGEQCPLPAAEATDSSASTLPTVPASEPPPLVKARTEESRVSSHRDLANPLVPPSFEETARPAVAGPESPIGPELDQITVMFRDYRTIIGENPVGTNAEIMKAIMGGNAKGAMLGPPEGQSVNGNGELIDRWGTPYFFHQLTSDLIEIRSAGPDRRLWNEDDIIGK